MPKSGYDEYIERRLLRGNKACTRCEIRKPLSEFHNSSAAKDGKRSMCTTCQKDYEYQLNYGISFNMYEKLCLQQEYRCLICDELPTGRGRSGKLHVDHDHKTGEIRGLLCGNCNKALGLIYDSPELLRRAADYIEHFKQVRKLQLVK